MSLALKRIKAYLKLAIIIAVVVAILLVVLKNRTNTADVWLFADFPQVNVLWLILVTAVSAVVIWWGLWKVFGVLRELREVRRLRQAQAQIEDQRRLAQELAEREKRIDAKVRRSISEEADPRDQK